VKRLKPSLLKSMSVGRARPPKPRPAAISYDLQVFINCPFDEAYWPMLKTIVFVIHACSLVPRCAMEADDAGEERLGKILRIIGECRLGIHDLSRKTTDANSGMARFNMPFEMGLFLGAANFGRRKKAMLVMEAEPFDYQRFISDISGRDIRHHRNDSNKLIMLLRDWLNAQKLNFPLPGGKRIASLYQRFNSALPHLLEIAGLDECEIGPGHFINWSDLVNLWLETQASPP